MVPERLAAGDGLHEQRDDRPAVGTGVLDLEADPRRFRGRGQGDDQHNLGCLDLTTERRRQRRAEASLPLVEPDAQAMRAELAKQSPRDSLVLVGITQEDADPGRCIHGLEPCRCGSAIVVPLACQAKASQALTSRRDMRLD